MSIVGALFLATTAEGNGSPHDTVQFSILYPAKLTGSDREHSFGIVDADPAGAPYPVVIHLNGVNCDPHGYRWLLLDQVRRGYVAVTVSWVAETMPGVVALTPGMDLSFCRPGTYGTGPTASAVAPALRVLAAAHAGDGPLSGVLDLDRIALGGHSGGGTVALHSADTRYFPGVRAAFSYGAHTLSSTALGFEDGTILPLSADMPFLLLGGSEDGVIASSAARYGIESRPDAPMRRTFDEGIAGERGDRYLAILRGANHFTVVHPSDPPAGRAFLDRSPTEDETALRRVISAAVGYFLDAHVGGEKTAQQQLLQCLSGPLVQSLKRK